MATPAASLDLPFFEGRAVNHALELPSEGWLARNMFGYAVWHYDDAVGILRDKRWHSASGRIPELMGITNEEFLNRQSVNILSAEGEIHTRLRRLVAPAFSPRSAERLRPFMRQVINDLVDRVAASGRADFATDICEPYPIPIICELLGAPKEDWQLFSRWANDVLEIFSLDVAEKLDLIMKTQDELDAYTRELIAARRSKPADDLLTDLIAAEEAGDRLSTDELVMMVTAVIVGGTDTTRNQLGCAVNLFAEHPAQWAMLAERPEMAQRAVEEAMRYFGAVRGRVRLNAASASDARPDTTNVHRVAALAASPVSGLASAVPSQLTNPCGCAASTAAQFTKMNVNGHAARIQPIVPPMRTMPNSLSAFFMLANAIELVIEMVGT